MYIGKNQFSLACGASNPKFLTAVVVLLCIALLCVSTILAFLLGKSHEAGDAVNGGPATITAVRVAQSPNEAEAKLLQEQLKQLTETLTNSIAELKSAKEKLQSYEIAEQERQRTVVAAKSASRLEVAKTLPPNPAKRIRVYEILKDYGHLQCRTQIGEILIKNLPREVRQYLEQVKRMKAEYAAMSDNLERQDREARRANAVALTGAGGNAAYVDAAMAERARANLMTENVRDANIALAKYKAALTSWENVAEERTTIFAVQTSQTYAGFQVWEFTGMAPKPGEASNQ